MANRFVSVGDDLTLPAAVKAADANLPARLQDAALNATYAPKKVEQAATRQAWLYADFMRRLRTGAAATIACRGDSMTYGHDTVSGDKVAAVPPHTATSSPSPYPLVLEQRLDEVYAGEITVINQGYSGDYTKQSFDRWDDNPGAHLTLIMLGTNDSAAAWVPVEYRANLQAYVESLEEMVLRDIEWGSAVVLLTPPKLRGGQDTAILDSYRAAVFAIGTKYGIPVIDTEPFTANYSGDAYSDDTHLNTKGYTAFGTRLAAAFIGAGPQNPLPVTNGTKVLTRKSIDNIVLGTSQVGVGTSPGYPTPPEGTANVGGIGLTLGAAGANGDVWYSFYTDAPDMIVTPVYYLLATGTTPDAHVTASLDFGIEQPDNSIDYLAGQALSMTARAASSFTHTINSSEFHNYLEAGSGTGKTTATVKSLRIATPGWHSLKISGGLGSASTGLVALHGLEFIGHRAFNAAALGSPQAQIMERGIYVPGTFSAGDLPLNIFWTTAVTVNSVLIRGGSGTGLTYQVWQAGNQLCATANLGDVPALTMPGGGPVSIAAYTGLYIKVINGGTSANLSIVFNATRN